ncbi:GerMN domain-containing protein [Actinoplanes sp. NPDC024001]|uniref:GerMN domain-containing protein n=1 Tax=Actinoplanes sp. NPDC024001 TaxID=3154598 RepID=UPI0033E7C4CC
MPAMIKLRFLTTVTATALLLAACGVAAQDEPHRVELPRRPLNVTSSAAVTQPAGDAAQVLCLVRENRLSQTVRRVDSVSDPQRHLDQLLAGPTPAEQAQGLSSALAATDLRVRLPAGSMTADVEISEPDEGAARSDEVLAYGQIVCTLTSRSDIAAVSFRRDGEPLQVPRGDGTLSNGVLRAGDYRSLIGPS